MSLDAKLATLATVAAELNKETEELNEVIRDVEDYLTEHAKGLECFCPAAEFADHRLGWLGDHIVTSNTFSVAPLLKRNRAVRIGLAEFLPLLVTTLAELAQTQLTCLQRAKKIAATWREGT